MPHMAKRAPMSCASTRTRSSNGVLTIGLALWAITASLDSAGVQAAIAPRSPVNASHAANHASMYPAEDTRTERLYASGVQAYQDGDMTNAIYWWRQAGAEGHLLSQYNLGSAYASGAGVPVDMAEAAYWWRLAALQDNTDAQYNLGVLYYEGKGAERNVSVASMWWYMAAMSGDAAAQYRLGYLAISGDNGEINFADAAWWWQRSAAQGYEPAAQALKRLRAGETQPVGQNW